MTRGWPLTVCCGLLAATPLLYPPAGGVAVATLLALAWLTAISIRRRR